MGKYKKFERKKQDGYFEIIKKIESRDDVIRHENLNKSIKEWDFESYHKLKLKGE